MSKETDRQKTKGKGSYNYDDGDGPEENGVDDSYGSEQVNLAARDENADTDDIETVGEEEETDSETADAIETVDIDEVRSAEEGGDEVDVPDEEADTTADVPSQTRMRAEFYDDGITPDAPEEVNIDRVEKYYAVADMDELEDGGANTLETFIGHTSDGDTMVVKTPGNHSFGGHRVAEAMKEAIQLDELPDSHTPEAPEAFVDHDRGAVVTEDVAGEDSAPPHAHGFEKGSVNTDSYLNAWAYKAVSGDWDMGGNILAKWDDDSEEYVFAPIDFDFAGSTTAGRRESFEEATEGFLKSLGNGLVGDEDDDTTPFNDEEAIGTDEAKKRLQEFAEAVDLDVLEEKLEEAEERHQAAEDDDPMWEGDYVRRTNNEASRLKGMIEHIETLREGPED